MTPMSARRDRNTAVAHQCDQQTGLQLNRPYTPAVVAASDSIWPRCHASSAANLRVSLARMSHSPRAGMRHAMPLTRHRSARR